MDTQNAFKVEAIKSEIEEEEETGGNYNDEEGCSGTQKHQQLQPGNNASTATASNYYDAVPLMKPESNN